MRSRFDDSVWPSLLRWTAAIGLVAAAHGGFAWLIMHRPAETTEPGGEPPAIMIELAAIATSVDAPEFDVVDGELAVEAEQADEQTDAPQPEIEAVPEPMPEEIAPVDPVPEIEAPAEAERSPPEKEQPPPEEEPAHEVEPAEQPDPEASPPEPVAEPDMPVAASAEVLLGDAPFPARRPDWLDERPTTPTAHEQQSRPQPKPTQQSAASTSAAPLATKAQTAEQTAAPSAGASRSPSISPARWQSSLNAHLNRYKRKPPGSGRGQVYVRFTIDSAGAVSRIGLVQGSGDPRLDEAAVDLVRRANPVPAPPADLLSGGRVTLTVPVNFTR